MHAASCASRSRREPVLGSSPFQLPETLCTRETTWPRLLLPGRHLLNIATLMPVTSISVSLRVCDGSHRALFDGLLFRNTPTGSIHASVMIAHDLPAGPNDDPSHAPKQTYTLVPIYGSNSTSGYTHQGSHTTMTGYVGQSHQYEIAVHLSDIVNL